MPPAMRRAVLLTIQTHSAMDEGWDDLVRRSAESDEGRAAVESIACAAGCAACCSYLVDTLASEAALIAAGVEASDPSYKDAVMERLLDWEYEFAHWLLKHPMPSRAEERSLEHDLWRGTWQARRLACPFLDLGDNTCSIYADRPATCRGHHACYPPPQALAERSDVGIPPEGCFTKLEDIQRGELTPIWTINAGVSEMFSRTLHEVMDRHNLPHDVFLLPISVLNCGRSIFGWPTANSRKKRNTPPRIRFARKEHHESACTDTA